MFTTEIRINGSLFAHVYGRNTGVDAEKSLYTYEYYETESRQVRTGEVRHTYEDGIRKLIILILEDVELRAKALRITSKRRVIRNLKQTKEMPFPYPPEENL